MRGSFAGGHNVLNRAAILSISLYQRHLSPRKGFCCAHRALHQGLSCSEAVKQIIAAAGIIGGLRQIQQRFTACKEAAATLHMMATQTQEERDAEITRRIEATCKDATTCDRKNCGELIGIFCVAMP